MRERRGVPPAGAGVAGREHAAAGRRRAAARPRPRTSDLGPATGSCSARCGTAGSPASATRRSTAASGLTTEHQHAFTEESLPYEMPLLAQRADALDPRRRPSSTSAPRSRSASTCRRILRGEEQWVQFLSEPTGGSDLAGCVTRADRDGDEWVLNGSKIWSTAAMSADYALCLARTDWDAPKHRGLTMFIVEIHQPRHRSRPDQAGRTARSSSARSSSTTCALRDDEVVGDVNDGWTRRAGAARARAQRGRRRLALRQRPQLPRRRRRRQRVTSPRSRWSGPVASPTIRFARQLVAEAHALDVAQRGLVQRVTVGMGNGSSRSRPPRSPSCSPRRRPSARPRSASPSLGPTRSPGRPDPRPSAATPVRRSSSARPRAWPGAATRSSATSSPTACWGCRVSGPPTATCRSRTCVATPCPPRRPGA